MRPTAMRWRSAPRTIASRCWDARGDGRPLYVMQVEPLRENKFLYRGKIWIDARDFAVTRIEAEPAKNPSFWTIRSQIHHQYQKIGDFYLPALNQTVTDVRLGGKAVLTINYLDYNLGQQVATGPGSRHRHLFARSRWQELPITKMPRLHSALAA